jgi:preprotein translocase subunit SecG
VKVLKIIFIVIYFIVCLALIILAMLQSKDDEGLSSTISGSSTNNFFEQNKGRTKEGRMKKWTVILGIAFVILSIVLSALYIIE